MMQIRKVYKYACVLKRDFQLEMPIGAQILGAFYQGNEPQIWALIDPDASTEIRHFQVYGTGHLIEHAEQLRHISTFSSSGGSFIWHLFEVCND